MAARNFHVPLSDEMYMKLRQESDRQGRPATQLAREAIDEWLERRRRHAIGEAVEAYARQEAGRSDLDEVLERASVTHLVEDEP